RDQRGEFIQFQFELGRTKDPEKRRALAVRVRALVRKHAAEWLPKLSAALVPSVLFERGFPGRVSCKPAQLAKAIEALAPIAPSFDAEVTLREPEEMKRVATAALGKLRRLILRGEGVTQDAIAMLPND